jgi:coenzyme F420-reducing hydrogenase delta subunit/predicted transcriptional regulator
MAGVSRQQYASAIRLIRVMCSGRVDLEFIFRAFAGGQDGVFIGGCRLNECNYVTHGNYDALGNTYLAKKIIDHIGLNPERLSIEFMSGGEGNVLVDVVNRFTDKIKQLGPLGEAEGISERELRLRLAAVRRLVPYIKLVERERLRVPTKSEAAYTEFYNSDDVNQLIDDLIIEKLTISQIMALLRESPLSVGELAEILGLNRSELSRHLNSSARQGLVRFDEGQNVIVAA